MRTPKCQPGIPNVELDPGLVLLIPPLLYSAACFELDLEEGRLLG